ncbi:MAG: hypothetical protein AB8H80_14705 [Planctomycetota bacterium]
MTYLAVCGALFSGCETPKSEPPDYAPRPVVELRRWTVHEADERIGEVVELEIRDPKGPLRFFRVLDRAGRWLGHASDKGRFSRRVPFEAEEQDLGVWPMDRGLRELFEASAPVEMRPVVREADFSGGGERRPR